MARTRLQTWYVASGGLPAVTTSERLRSLLLEQRGVSADERPHFFSPQYDREIHDPSLLHSLSEAVDRIVAAIKKGERLLVFGDYDVDGITSTAILVTTLQDLGAQVVPFLPHRGDDGYGLSLETVRQLEPEFDLLITVDCGITSVEEVAWLKKRGKDVIIVDHHSPLSELPPARAIIHPAHPAGAYPFSSLCGAGTAWKLASALLHEPHFKRRDADEASKWLLDLVALGTVADMVPLLGENRAIVYFGLEILKRSSRPGLRALFQSARVDATRLSTHDLAWQVIPRLNSAGRMDHAQPALDLLLARDQARVHHHVAAINGWHTLRQSVTRRVVREAEAQAQLHLDLPFVFAYSLKWPAGVVGLVAGRLAEKFSRPAIIIGGNGRHAVGSARSPAAVNVLTWLQASGEHLLKLGGHSRAAGFSLAESNVAAWRDSLLASAAAAVASKPSPGDSADAVIDLSLLTWSTVQLLDAFAPYGQGNERPRFVVRKLPLVDSRPVGKKSEHAKMTFLCNDEPLDGIGFGLFGRIKEIGQNVRVDVLGELEENEWRGRRRLQLAIKDVAPAGQPRIRQAIS